MNFYVVIREFCLSPCRTSPLTGRASSSLRCQISRPVRRPLHLSESFTTSLLIDLASWSVDLVGSESLRESDSVSRDTEKRDGVCYDCVRSCLPLAVITGLCVSLMDVFIASGLVQWIQIARIVNSKYPPPPLYLQGVCPRTQIFALSTAYIYLLSLSEVSEGAGSLARNCLPLISLFSMKGLFS